MKKILILLGLLSTLSSFACSTYEAQFSSVVKEVLTIPGEPYACWLKLDINLSQAGQSYRPHMICPLDIEEVYNGRIYSRRCNYLPGDEISGFLVKSSCGRVELD
ncbi:MAG TPA: hypothetical protein VKZ84_01515 [Bacteriovoracaceae bacterium]|nr:hypothetical protein [Bacteriovoracaceae bacterium]